MLVNVVFMKYMLKLSNVSKICKNMKKNNTFIECTIYTQSINRRKHMIVKPLY